MVNSSSGWNPAAGLRGGQPLKGILKQPKPFVPPPRQAPPAFPPSNSYPSRQHPPRPRNPEPGEEDQEEALMGEKLATTATLPKFDGVR